MKNVQSQFIAVCPECSASMKVASNKLGENISCPRCHHSFIAGEASLPDNPRSGERPAVPANQEKDQIDRIEAVCTNCNATLRVRRAYIGNDVRCKHCNQVFRVLVEASTLAKTEPDQPDPRQQALEAEHKQLQVAHSSLQVDHERLKTEYTDLRENLRCVTIELESIRAALGTIAPEEVGSLANERQSLSAEVDRLRDEIPALFAAQSERDQLVAERQSWVSELDSAHAQHDLLKQQLNERDDRLESSRAEHNRLSVERQTALSELDQLRIALAQNDEVTHRECGGRHSEGIDANEIDARVEPTSTAVQGSIGEHSSSAAELEGLRARVAELSQQLDESEITHRAMAEVLEGIGIRCRTARI